jgi:alkaline phosphatase
MRRLVLAALACCGIGLGSQAWALEPMVRGPESVTDWYAAGTRFIEAAQQRPDTRRRAKNVILFVGDGMGISTLTAARILEGQLGGRPGEENRLSFETFPHVALSKTYSWDQQTSDSAPTMTAIATGHKAREGMLSVDHLTARGECSAAVTRAHALKSILEHAAESGRATGIVSTARLTHATPAALYAHIAFRDWEADSNQPDISNAAPCRGAEDGVKDIARQLIEVSPAVRRSLKVALGGGRSYFLPALRGTSPVFDPEYPTVRGRRADGRDLTAEWLASRGPRAAYVWNHAQLAGIDAAGTSHLLGLFEPSHMQYEVDRARDGAGEPSLSDMTAKALHMLANDRKGYFLHVEGGRIDHAHHAGNAQRALLETIEFARAVRYAMDHTDAKDTLIIVTADHSHTFTIAGYPSRGNNILGLVREVPATDGAPLAPARDANGAPFTTLGYANGPGHRAGARPDLTRVDTTGLDFLQEAAVPLGSETHAGEDVAIFARGPGSHLVHGSMEQNWIFHVMRRALGL